MAAISTFVAAAGLGLSAFGMFTSQQGAQGSVEAQQGITQGELEIEAKKKQAMELDARRKKLEIVRFGQQARSAGLANAVNQGAQFGSGLPGGQAQIQGGTAFNLQGVDQNLAIGRDIFGINARISQYRMDLAAAQGQMYTGQGFSSLGGSFLSVLPQLSRLGQGFGADPGKGGARGSSPPTYPSNPFNFTGSLY